MMFSNRNILFRNGIETSKAAQKLSLILALYSSENPQISWFETQADWFAGQLLVPTTKLEENCKSIIDKYYDKIKKIIRNSDDFWSYASNEIAHHFEVNPPVIEIRIKKENISERIKII